MNEKFSLELCSDLDLEGMAIDISYNNETIASINYDQGIENIEIEILPISRKLLFPLEDFCLVLEKAKKLAIKCAQEDRFKKNE